MRTRYRSHWARSIGRTAPKKNYNGDEHSIAVKAKAKIAHAAVLRTLNHLPSVACLDKKRDVIHDPFVFALYPISEVGTDSW
jgi:hypothetical protein